MKPNGLALSVTKFSNKKARQTQQVDFRHGYVVDQSWKATHMLKRNSKIAFPVFALTACSLFATIAVSLVKKTDLNRPKLK